MRLIRESVELSAADCDALRARADIVRDVLAAWSLGALLLAGAGEANSGQEPFFAWACVLRGYFFGGFVFVGAVILLLDRMLTKSAAVGHLAAIAFGGILFACPEWHFSRQWWLITDIGTIAFFWSVQLSAADVRRRVLSAEETDGRAYPGGFPFFAILYIVFLILMLFLFHAAEENDWEIFSGDSDTYMRRDYDADDF